MTETLCTIFSSFLEYFHVSTLLRRKRESKIWYFSCSPRAHLCTIKQESLNASNNTTHKIFIHLRRYTYIYMYPHILYFSLQLPYCSQQVLTFFLLLLSSRWNSCFWEEEMRKNAMRQELFFWSKHNVPIIICTIKKTIFPSSFWPSPLFNLKKA